ncbi:MAG: glutathione S-transferase C-terminal domain-containing protein, partial [Bauldia litoralis]
MGIMVDGVWHTDEAPLADDKTGRFIRKESAFRNWVTADGSPGPSGEGGFEAEPGRYHLYISISCPWAHRTRLVRAIKRLEDLVGISIATPRRTDQGWTYDNSTEAYGDPLYGIEALHTLYSRADPGYSGRVTVPTLWDTQRETIVNNESSEIIRMFNDAFAAHAPASPDLYPADLRDEIEAVNERTYEGLNNGVYRAGFATAQEAYEEAARQVFDTLDWMEDRLSKQRYLAGDRLTLADWRAFPTLVRFDCAYVSAFKCNLRRLIDYPNLWGYTRELYQMPGVA